MRINDQITSETVRLIGKDGDAIGIVPISEAINHALRETLDLVEISPDSNPPVCKIINYSKMRYEIQRKETEKRKHAKKSILKELRFGAHIGEHDYQVKVNHAIDFLKCGDKVKIAMILRGRQNAHKDLAIELFNKLKNDLNEVGRVDSDISIAGNYINMTLSPKKV